MGKGIWQRKPLGHSCIRFGNVIEAAYRRSGRQVVILVDEAESIKKLAEANGISEDEC